MIKTLLAGAILLFAGTAFSGDIPESIIEASNANVYHVLNEDKSTGSAYYIGNNRLVTACHVIEERKNAILVNYDSEFVLTANVLSCNTENDIAILELTPHPDNKKAFSHQPPEFSTEHPKTGQLVYGAGYPMNIGLIYVEGHWQNLLHETISKKAAIITTPAMYGDSGSPAFVIQDGKVKYLGTRNGMFTYPIHGKMTKMDDMGFVHITYIEMIESTISELDKLGK